MDHHSPLRVDSPLRQGVLAEIEAFSALSLEGEPDGSEGILSSTTLSRTYHGIGILLRQFRQIRQLVRTFSQIFSHIFSQI